MRRPAPKQRRKVRRKYTDELFAEAPAELMPMPDIYDGVDANAEPTL